jgi:RNA polymerase sigma-70 factor (ECF subfamily)
MKTLSADDDKDFKTVMLASLGSLRAFSISLCGHHDRADDLVQDTVMKAWANKTYFEPGTNMKAWLFTILRNQFYSQARKHHEVQDTDGFLTERMSSNPTQHGVVDLSDMRKALAKLPEEQREALILVGATGFTYEEAAEICGVAIGTIKSRVNRGRARLAELLGVSDDTEFCPEASSLAVTARPFAL